MREEALSARVNSCPSQNLRECELWVGGGGKNITAALSFCHSEELQFRGICFAAPPDREQGFPRRLPPARGFQKRGSIGTAEAVPFPTLGNSRADTIRLRFVSGHAFIRAVRVGRFASCRGRRGEDITGGARLLVVPLWPHFRFVIPRNFKIGRAH